MANEERVSELVSELLDGIAGRMEDIAGEAGVSYSALYSWATGRRRPGKRNLEKLARLAEDRSESMDALARRLRARAGSGRRSGGEQRPPPSGGEQRPPPSSGEQRPPPSSEPTERPRERRPRGSPTPPGAMPRGGEGGEGDRGEDRRDDGAESAA